MKYTMMNPGDQKKLFAAVAELECQLCGRHGTQVAHSNQSKDGKGMSLKSYPWRVAALCPACHVEIDSGKNLSKAERIEQWDEAHRKTIGQLFERGLIRPV
jgi:5-methylcytosine-specific restriction endonuclease McrA